jgi:molecular chaperone DnaK
MYLAIDFGTSFTSAAVVQDGQSPVVIKNIQNEGVSFFPSVFLVDDAGKTICGSSAEKQSRRFPDRFIKEIKLKIANEYIDHQGKQLSIDRLIGDFLQHIKEMAEAQVTQGLNLSIVVITIPVSYAENEKQLMTKAAKLAGFAQVEFLKEPMAAGLFHIMEEDLGKKLAVDESILIYDLGGGTFDTSVVQKKSANYCEEIKSLGNSRCGGSDFDACIYNYIIQKMPTDFQMSPSNEVLLSQLVTLFKHELSISESYGDIISFLPNDYSVDLSRKEFEQMLVKEKYLEATYKLVQNLVDSHDVSYILLVGGSCRIPYVGEQLKQFNKPIYVSKDPQLAVAKGAAYYGYWLANDAPQAYQQQALDLFVNNDFDANKIVQALKLVDRSLELQPNHHQSRALKGELLGIRGLVEMRLEWQKVTSGLWSELIGSKKSTLLSKYSNLYPEIFSVDKKIPLEEIKPVAKSENQPNKNFSLDLGKGILLEMVYITGGVFMMGAATGEADAQANEFPQHSVTVQSFYMAKYPVTQSQYQRIMGTNPAQFPGEKRPIENVTL